MIEVLNNLKMSLDSLTVYRGLLECEPLKSFYGITCEGNFIADWCRFFNELCRAECEENFRGCINSQIKYDVNPFSKRCAEKRKISTVMQYAVQHDLDVLMGVAGLQSKTLLYLYCEKYGKSDFISDLPRWESGETEELTYSGLVDFYEKNGCGEFAEHYAFVWREGGLSHVARPDPIRLSQLKNYEYQRGLVVDNTKAFLSGAPANNCLLYGDRGTGKSSTVKAVLNEYRNDGLRLVEMPKTELHHFPELIKLLAVQPLKFIIFIDDLSFSSDDDSYAALKAVLEGGIASRPDNTVIYATTNRRHLIKENFSSRNGDDVHFSDTMQESLSLSDRFGLTVTFQNPDKKRYLEIVEAIARDEGVEPTEELLAGAERFALERAVRSPRCARQYIDIVKSKISI